MRDSIVAVTAVACACGGEATRAPAYSVRDSAGIEIVESAEPRWSEREAWTLYPEPEVTIGVVEGEPAYLLSDVSGARRLPDGRIAILDVGSSSVRLYGPDGRHIRDIGGPGEGPGELRVPQYMDLVGDTIVVYEMFPGSLSWYLPDGTFVRRAATPTAPDGDPTRGLMFGVLEGRRGISFGIPIDRQFVEGLNRLVRPVWTFDLRRDSIELFREVLGAEEFVTFPRPGVTRFGAHHFGKQTYVASAADRVYIAPSDAYSIEVRAPDGELLRMVRRRVESVPVTPADVDRRIDQLVATFQREGEGVDEEAVRNAQRTGSVAARMPAYRWIVADKERNLWVEEWEDVGLGQGPFSVFGADGAWLGKVDVPAGLPRGRGQGLDPWVVEIGPDYFLGVWVDDLGVEQVRLYRIDKPGSG